MSKVKYAEIDEKYRKNIVLQVDPESRRSDDEVRIRLKLFFQDSEEVTPSVQFDGITLVK